MKSIINLLLLTSVTFSGKRRTSSTWAPGTGTPSPTPSNDELCGCYNIDLICAPIMNAGGEICYYYQIEKISDDDYCKPIDYISLGTGNLDECGLTSTDIQSSLLDYAPKCYDVDPLYDGTCNNGKIGVPGIKVRMGPPPTQNPDGSEPAPIDDYMVFSMCFDASKVSGFQESGQIAYKTKSGRATCDAYTILPNFCDPTDATTPSPVAPAPQTPAPVTPAPVTPSPTTPAPVTPNPTTPAPVTPAPVTPSPTTPAPTTPRPTTPAPVTPAPVTPAPVTPAPVTPSPTTPAPTTPRPTTPAPVTPAPVTPSPTTPAPTTPRPTTPAPVTPAPVTPSPTTPAPTTPSPTTSEPTTANPTTAAPSIAPTYVECSSSDELNIGFLLDESGSVDSAEWDIITQFVERIVTFDVSPTSYVALYEYASLANYQELLSFTGPKSDPAAEQLIIDTLQSNIYNPSGQTETWDAVNRVLDDFHDYKTIDNCDGNGDSCWQRSDILFLVTDGEPTGTPVCPDMATRMAQSDVDIVVILIDPNGDIDETKVSCLDVANGGADVIRLPSFDSDAFNAIEARIREKICSGNNPASTGAQPEYDPWRYADGSIGLGPIPTRSGGGQGGAADPVKINNNQKDDIELIDNEQEDININNNDIPWTVIIISASTMVLFAVIACLLCRRNNNNKSMQSVNDNEEDNDRKVYGNSDNNEGNLSIMV